MPSRPLAFVSAIALFCSGLEVAQQIAFSQQASSLGVAPRLIRYNAALPSSLSETGAVGVTFSVYRSQFDGAPLWSEVQNVQADSKGGYSVMLGSTRNEGLPMELFNTSETRWLEAEVNGLKQPRVQIGSVPYAMLAENAQTLGGLPPSAYLRVTSGVTPDSTSSANKNAATSNVFSAPFRPQATSGSGGYLAVFTSSTDLGTSALFQNGNTVTIGGTTSLGAFTLTGNAPGGDTAGMALFNAGGGAGASVSLDMYNTSFNGGIPQAKIKALDDGSYSDHLTFLLKNPGAATNPLVERMRITSVGNVGIGTMTPGSKLEIAGSVKISGSGNGITFPDGTSLAGGLAGSGSTNLGFGPSALSSNTTGSANSGIGIGVLQSNTSGFENTADGYHALQSNTTGDTNTATGYNALFSNTTGSLNAAFGGLALQNNTTGYSNTAIGVFALQKNVSGFNNTATGNQSLVFNTTGSANTATGSFALPQNTTGGNNTANGYAALQYTTTGSTNTAIGNTALYANSSGSSNTAVGNAALFFNTTGGNNTAVGNGAGNNLTSGNFNIILGNSGVSSDDHVIRIGDVQTQTFIAGITGVNVSGVPVVVSSTGQLGIASSSRRFKENIQDMGDASEKLIRLRPVTYNYKQAYEDGSKPLDYGLIAEEVAEVYPDLVAHSQDGQIQTVMYQKLTPMLLNEVQRLQKQNHDQLEKLTHQDKVIRAIEERLARLESKP